MTAMGYLDAQSVAWRVHSDSSGLVGGIRSLVVQALQPRAMAAVAHNGDFQQDFWGRLRRTSDFLLTIVYGTREEADHAGAIVRAVHSRIGGVDPYTGGSYRADEPELLLWVHNATVESHLTAFRMYGTGLTPDEADQYVSEMRVLGRVVGVDESAMPADEAELRTYFVEYQQHLAASPYAQQALRALFNAPIPLHLRPLWQVPAAAAVASLPNDYRRMYGFDWVAPFAPAVRVPATVLVRGLRLLLPPPPLVEQARMRAA